MLVLPPGHAQQVRIRGALSARERRLLLGVGGLLAALAVALIVSFAVPGPSSSPGCIYATIPAPTGAQQINECGVAARSTCATIHEPGAYTAQAAQVLATECRKAGLATGSS